MISRNTDYNEDSTVAAKLNRAKRTANLLENITEEAFQKYKQQFDKDIQNRRFFPGCTVYVYTTQRGKSHRKRFRPYKGPYLQMHRFWEKWEPSTRTHERRKNTIGTQEQL